MDFIFGTLATDELKLVHHRAARQGVQHAHQISPRDPRPGDAVTVWATIGPAFNADHVAVYYTTDDSEPQGEKGVATNGSAFELHPSGVHWDTLVWGYLSVWRGELPAQPDGTMVRYRIGAWQGDGKEQFADWPMAQDAAERAASAFFQSLPLPDTLYTGEGIGRTFAYHVDTQTPPDWARDAIIYQVFVDRFSPGQGGDWIQTDHLGDICGGTLYGVTEKLDYIETLGANCIWLSPIFPSPSHHGYDATDYFSVEPRFGGNDALRELVKAAHARGIRVLLDLACNHIANTHELFQEALKSPDSPCRNWFIFDDSTIGYRSFFGVATMPQLNVANPAVRDWLCAIGRYWIEQFDVDGYRLDYANGCGPDFWSEFRVECKAAKPDSFCFGEVIDAPGIQAEYAGRLDGCLDFHSGEALRKAYGWKTTTPADFERFYSRHSQFFPDDFVMPSFLDNHDMDRFLFIAGGDKEALKQAAARQMQLPNPPIIYYGTEVGLSQIKSTRDGFGLEVSRTPMVWDERQDADLLAFYKQIIRERKGRG